MVLFLLLPDRATGGREELVLENLRITIHPLINIELIIWGF